MHADLLELEVSIIQVVCLQCGVCHLVSYAVYLMYTYINTTYNIYTYLDAFRFTYWNLKCPLSRLSVYNVVCVILSHNVVIM